MEVPCVLELRQPSLALGLGAALTSAGDRAAALPGGDDLLVEGLRAGERAGLLAPPGRAHAEEGEAPFHGRVLHALTGEPLKGVWIEVWSEDLSPPLHLPVLLSEVRSGPDGGFRLPGR